MQSDRIQRVHNVVRRHIEAGNVTGAIVLVRHDGAVVFHEAQGVADAETKQPLQPDTVYWVASMTKTIIAVSTMMLVEAGRISLADPVSKYVPEFAKPATVRTLLADSPPLPPFPPPPGLDPNTPKPAYDTEPARRPITVEDLITMTSGLQTIGIPNDAIPAVTMDDTLATRIPRLADAPLDFQPGTRWHYSNATGFDVLARIIEVAAGQPLAAFTKQRIFDPLAMDDTSFGVRESLQSRLAPLGAQAGTPLAAGKYTSGSAGVWSTVTDYGKFGQMLLDGGMASGRRLLKAETVREMSTNHVGSMFKGMTPGEYASREPGEGRGVGYGLGFGIVTDAAQSNRRVPSGSFGWDGVGSRRYWVVPALNAVIVMLTLSAGRAYDAAQLDIEGAVCDALR